MSERVKSPTPPVSSPDPAQPSVQHLGDSVTTGSLPVVEPAPPPRTRRVKAVTRPFRQPVGLWVLVLTLGSLAVGALAGVLWRAVVPLTIYHVDDNGYATTSERGLTNIIAGDAWYVLIGLGLGIVLGLVIWRLFAGLGWPLVLIALGEGLLMGLACWLVGRMLGPGDLFDRVATAAPGQDLPVELTLRAGSGLLVWPFAVLLPIMLISALAPDPEEPRTGAGSTA